VTDKQLAILLHGYVERIREAGKQADEALGDGVECEKLTEWKYIGKGYGLLSNYFTHPEDWEEVVSAGTAVALDPLWDLIQDIEWDIESLLDGSG